MGYDHREINHRWYTKFSEKDMVVVIEIDDVEHAVPVKYEVCNVCQGKGSHVNPSIDSGGLSQEDFDEDPEFERMYFSGRFDMPCVGCRGNRVIPEPDYDQMTKEMAKQVEDFIADFFRDQREQHREREMGY